MTQIFSTEIKHLAKLFSAATAPVFFGGAGVSTASGIPDFRSQDGLYNQEYKFPPEQIISHSFFTRNPAEFYRFYFDKICTPVMGNKSITPTLESARPNAAHQFLSRHKIPVITQNIDGLHSLALLESNSARDTTSQIDFQSRELLEPQNFNIFELHGSIFRNTCQKCGAFYGLDGLMRLSEQNEDGVPRCVASQGECQGILKPDVVLYEEPLNRFVWEGAEDAINNADLLVVGGTSMVVYPAASLVSMFTSRHPDKPLAVINKEAVSADSDADLVIHSDISQVFKELEELL